MNKTLIVYFSHSGENYFSGSIKNIKEGNTKVVCTKLASLLNVDTFEIEPINEYPVHYEACTSQAKKELQQEARPQIKGIVPNLDDYQTIYLAYPNWWGTYPRIVATFIENYDLSGKDIYPICTHEGSGMGNSERELKKVLKNSTVHKGCPIQGSKAQSCETILKTYIGG